MTCLWQGLAFDALQQCFRSADVDALLTMEAPPKQWKQTVYMLIDPAAGGPQSDFALVSFTRHKGQITVCSRAYVLNFHVTQKGVRVHALVH